MAGIIQIKIVIVLADGFIIMEFDSIFLHALFKLIFFLDSELIISYSGGIVDMYTIILQLFIFLLLASFIYSLADTLSRVGKTKMLSDFIRIDTLLT